MAKYLTYISLVALCAVLPAACNVALAQDTDPTQPPTRIVQAQVQATELESLTLTSVWYRPATASQSAAQSTALINEQRVREGDSIGGYRIVRIHPNSVIVRTGNNQDIELTVFSDDALSIQPSRVRDEQ
ncbi:MAG: hypothetical protein M1473_05625 [Firmicutes bacterium]|nr:hypothetical protein [Bacillota bacterium]